MPADKTYPMPWLGQPYKRVQNEFDIEYGAVTGVKITGEYIDAAGVARKSWTACIESGIAHTFRFYHNTPAGEWEPLTPAEMAELRGAAIIGDVVDKATFLALQDRLDIAESKLVEANLEFARLHERVNAYDHPKAPAAVAVGALAPQNGTRPSRVAPPPTQVG
jgi:hypothetical protein